MPRLALIVALILVGTSAFAASQATTQESDGFRKTESKLNGPVTVHFSGTALSECLKLFGDLSGVKPNVDWDALRKAGIAPGAKVTARVQGGRMKDALGAILKSGSGGNAGYEIDDDGTVVVTTLDVLKKRVVTRRYDVADLRASHDLEDLSRKMVAAAGLSDEDVSIENNILVVTATRTNHRLVAQLLEQLRQRQDAAATRPAEAN